MVCDLPSMWDCLIPKNIVPLRSQTKPTKIMAKIYVNGDALQVQLPLNLSELIKQLLVENPEMVSVQVNEEFAEHDDWENIQIQESDKVDFLYFRGGGAR